MITSIRPFLLCLVGLGLAPAACQPDVSHPGDGDAPITAKSKAITWPGQDGVTTIPVCWLFTGYDADKAYVRGAVEKGWSGASSLVFTDWGLCDGSQGDSLIRISRTTGVPTESHSRSAPLYSDISLNFTYPSTYNPDTNQDCKCPSWNPLCVDGDKRCDSCDTQHSFCDGQFGLQLVGSAIGFNQVTNKASIMDDGLTLAGFSGLYGDDVKMVKKKYETTPLRFSSAGSLLGYACVQLKETRDPNGWSNNYLCSNGNQDISWSGSGAISGKRCTQITEPQEPTSHTWGDNYVCVPNNSPLQLTWSSEGRPDGYDGCVQFTETTPGDAGWDNNYLCYTSRYWFSSASANNGQSCISLNEPSDPDSWGDNYLCSNQSTEDIRWSTSGPIAGMKCTQITEPSEPSSHGWSNNYICVAADSKTNFEWSYDGPIANKTCIRFYESADPDTWTDNYLCYTISP